MAPLSDVALALELQAESKADQSDVTVIRRKAARNRWRSTAHEEWRRGRSLGEGGFGEVYLEECISGGAFGHVRAVKRLQKARNENYHHELNAIALFSLGKYSESFVQCFGWYATEQHIYLSMEYFPHGDLQQYLDHPLPEHEGQLILVQLLEALEHMHERNFTHRDLKPGNLLVSTPGPDWVIKVADFGISKRTEEGMTALRTIMGTQKFAAPEVFFSDHMSAYTSAVDIWSAGIIALLVLVGMINVDFNAVRKYSFDRQTPFPDQALVDQKISTDGRSFVETLLQRDAQSRPTATQSLWHPWLSNGDFVSRTLERMSIEDHRTSVPRQMLPIPGQFASISRAASSSDAGTREVLMMGDSSEQAAHNTGSLLPTGRWSMFESDPEISHAPDTERTDTPRVKRRPLTSNVDSVPQRQVQQEDDTIREPAMPRLIEKRNFTKLDIPIAVKVSVDRKLGTVELLLKDLAADVFPEKLNQALKMPTGLPCQLQWFNDSIGDFEALDQDQPETFREFVAAAGSKREIRVKVIRVLTTTHKDYGRSLVENDLGNNPRLDLETIETPRELPPLRSRKAEIFNNKDFTSEEVRDLARHYNDRVETRGYNAPPPLPNEVKRNPLPKPQITRPDQATGSRPPFLAEGERKRLQRLLEEEEQAKRRKQAEIEKETERLRKLYGPPSRNESLYTESLNTESSPDIHDYNRREERRSSSDDLPSYPFDQYYDPYSSSTNDTPAQSATRRVMDFFRRRGKDRSD